MQKIVNMEKMDQQSTLIAGKCTIQKELEKVAIKNFTVNHKFNFVDLTMSVEKQHVARMWSSVNWHNKK